MARRRFATIDEYIASFPQRVQPILQKMRQTIRKAVPEAAEAMSYQIPTFKLQGKNLVHFAAFERHVGFYPTPSGIAAFQKELSGFKQAKGSVQFPLDRPIPYDLVKKIVAFRLKDSSTRWLCCSPRSSC
jgi:uncharacterized protein YdhG (YjbR/CyaY superfamily)